LLPLVPALLLYGFFSSSNSATYDDTGVQLGGPAALYVVLLLVAVQYANKRLFRPDPLKRLKMNLAGEWDTESLSVESGQRAVSTATFDFDGDELVLTGGSFRIGDAVTGHWSPDRVILDGDRDGVVYLYELRDVSTRNTWRGLMELTLARKTEPLHMEGTWEVIGPDYHRGTVRFTKRTGHAGLSAPARERSPLNSTQPPW
jgi:hypothetical protein